jgi:foldase protein PrsA
VNNVRVLWGIIGGLVILLAVVSWAWMKDSVSAVATVGGDSISEKEWTDRLKLLYGDEVLKELINRRVVEQEAKRLGIHPDEKQVKREMDAIRNNYGGEAQYRQELLKQVGSDEEALREEVVYQLLLREIATREIVIDEEELRQYYHKHLDEFTRPMTARVWQIVTGSEEEALQVRRELQEGANFATLARERSIDNLTAENGGDLGVVSENDPYLSAEFLQKVRTLPLNEDSMPFPVENGYAVIRVTQRSETEQLPFEDVKEEIRQIIAFARISTDEVLEKLRNTVGVQLSPKSSH